MVKNLLILALATIVIAFSSCRPQVVDDIDLTPINKELLKAGWHFDSVRAVINTKDGTMQNTAANVCQNFMKKTMDRRTLYFTEDTAYCIVCIDDEEEMYIKRSKYTIDNHILSFEQTEKFMGNWYLPFWYIKEQTPDYAIFYLTKDEIVVLLEADGSVPRNIIDKLESGACYCYFSRCENLLFYEIDEAEKANAEAASKE